MHCNKNLLCHLQRLIDIGGQDGQEVIYATDKESTYKTIREKQSMILRSYLLLVSPDGLYL